MAHIPIDDIQTLWRQTKEHNWQGLEQTLKSHRNEAGGIDDKMVDTLISIAQKMAKSGKPFPGSADQLYEMLNQQVQGEQVGKGPG